MVNTCSYEALNAVDFVFVDVVVVNVVVVALLVVTCHIVFICGQ